MYKLYIHVQTVYTCTNCIYIYKQYTHVQMELGRLRCVDVCLLIRFIRGYVYAHATWRTSMCGHVSTDGFHTWACVYRWNLENSDV